MEANIFLLGRRMPSINPLVRQLMRDRGISRREAEEIVAEKYKGLRGIFEQDSHRYGGKGEARKVLRVIK